MPPTSALEPIREGEFLVGHQIREGVPCVTRSSPRNRARVRDLLVHAKCLSIAAIASAVCGPSRLRCRDRADQPR